MSRPISPPVLEGFPARLPAPFRAPESNPCAFSRPATGRPEKGSGKSWFPWTWERIGPGWKRTRPGSGRGGKRTRPGLNHVTPPDVSRRRTVGKSCAGKSRCWKTPPPGRGDETHRSPSLTLHWRFLRPHPKRAIGMEPEAPVYAGGSPGSASWPSPPAGGGAWPSASAGGSSTFGRCTWFTMAMKAWANSCSFIGI